MKQYKKVVVIGRFQLLHLGHIEMLKKAFELGEEVYIFIGSANSPRNLENPFSYQDRYIMLNLAINEITERHGAFKVLPLDDISDDNEAWVDQIVDVVGRGNKTSKSVGDGYFDISPDIAYVGGAKKEWYVSLLEGAGYEHRQIPPYKTLAYNDEKYGGEGKVEIDLSSTILRKTYFTGYYDDVKKFLKPRIPSVIYDYLMDYMKNRFFGYINAWHWKKTEDNAKYGTGPFLTCDNIIQVGDEILLIKRKNHPGKGLWAIAGGYLEKDETLAQGAARELEEEVSLRLPIEMFDNMRIFDKVNRSTYARIITAAFHIVLPIKPETKAADDAIEKKWFTREEIKGMHNIMHDDHWYIIKQMVGFN